MTLPILPADRTGPYRGYVYAYPHKTAYRPLEPSPRLSDVWAAEPRDALFLYLHVPFCEMRCGFCNLFTRTGASGDLTAAYLDALERQAGAVRDAVGEAAFATVAFGGGTPTFLTTAELARLCDLAGRFADLTAVPLSVETSPSTSTTDRLTLLAERGADRISIGVQSFVAAETRAAVRPQKRADVERALDRIRTVGFDTLNIDLIYGIEGQTARTWLCSLEAALAWEPEELYLYPLYVRPLTGLGRRSRDWDDQRIELYRIGRDHLLGLGYEQVSMRMFRRPGTGEAGTEYSCQTDGMVGLGSGARSYTSGLHYSFEYAVEAGRVRGIIDEYVRETDFEAARVGFRLDEHEHRRRHLIYALLQAPGLSRPEYRRRFGTDAAADFAAELQGIGDQGWLEYEPDTIRLTPDGLAHSDAIGPALFSPTVRALMDGYEAR
jgi:oxygen-independent coproporphyrinogen-3 oxidase